MSKKSDTPKQVWLGTHWGPAPDQPEPVKVVKEKKVRAPKEKPARRGRGK